VDVQNFQEGDVVMVNLHRDTVRWEKLHPQYDADCSIKLTLESTEAIKKSLKRVAESIESQYGSPASWGLTVFDSDADSEFDV
jgi:hypothetical protein